MGGPPGPPPPPGPPGPGPPSSPARRCRCIMTRPLQMSMNISNLSINLSFSSSLALRASISFCFSSSTFFMSSRAFASSRRRSERMRSSGDWAVFVYIVGRFSAMPEVTFCGFLFIAALALYISRGRRWHSGFSFWRI